MTVALPAAAPSVPEPELPTEMALNPEKAAALKAPPPRTSLPQGQTVAPVAAPLTPDYGDVVTPQSKAYANAPAEDEYVLISNSAPELIKEIAMQTPEDSGPPSEALSVILGRAAVAEHLMHLEDTLGVRPTPVPVPVNVQNKRRKRHVSAEPEADPTPPDRPTMHHAAEKNSNSLVMTLLIIIGILALGILVLLVFQLGGKEKESSQRSAVSGQQSVVSSQHSMGDKVAIR